MACDIDKLVENYINGIDSKKYPVELLENSKHFMEKVLTKTHDTKMYHYCSDKVKGDTGFMRYLIKTFKDDLDFLCEAADGYFDNTEDEYDNIEIAIVMRGLLKYNDDDRYLKYDLMSDVLYAALRLQVEHDKFLQRDDHKFQTDEGLGFWFVLECHRNNEIVANFYAKKMLKELFIDDYYALDRILHTQYKSVEEIEEKGIYNVILGVIRVYDNNLADYVCTRKELLKKVLKKYQSTIKRWDKYVDINEVSTYDKIDERINQYVDEVENTGLLSIREIITLAGVNLGVEEKLTQYNIIDIIDVDLLKEELDRCNDIVKTSFIDRLIYTNIKDIMKSMLFGNKKVEQMNENKCQVLNMDNYRKVKTPQKLDKLQ